MQEKFDKLVENEEQDIKKLELKLLELTKDIPVTKMTAEELEKWIEEDDY